MKPFNIEEAKAGKKVQTRGGEVVELLKFDRNHLQQIVGLRGGNEDPCTWCANGSWSGSEYESPHDLVMATEVKEYWVCFCPENTRLYKSKEEAEAKEHEKSKLKQCAARGVFAKITWEE